jgi:hypothetical protein
MTSVHTRVRDAAVSLGSCCKVIGIRRALTTTCESDAQPTLPTQHLKVTCDTNEPFHPILRPSSFRCGHRTSVGDLLVDKGSLLQLALPNQQSYLEY